jgi:hypothetical protein
LQARGCVWLLACALAPAWAQLKPATAASARLQWPAAATWLAPGVGPGLLGTADDDVPGTAGLARYSLHWGARYRLGVGLMQPRAEAPSAAAALGLKSRGIYTFYAEPGYTLTESTLLYGRLSYGALRDDGHYVGEAWGRAVPGLGLGAGVRTMLGEHLFLQFELLVSDYEWQGLRAGLLRPSAASGSVGLGWRF